MTQPSDLERRLASKVADVLSRTGCSKRTAVRHALNEAIHLGVLRPGDMLPPEKRLAEVLGVSLGTVQAALGELRNSGRVMRRRGDGTRVSSADDVLRSSWHFRLLDRETRQPVFWGQADVDVAETRDAGPWVSFLRSEGPFVRIRRRIRMHGDRMVGAEMYLTLATGQPLLKMNPTDLALVNLRTVLAQRLSVVATGVTTQISICTVGEADAAALELTRGMAAFEIEASVWGGESAPIYFQRVLAGCDEFRLSF